jgi:hypothetical protein
MSLQCIITTQFRFAEAGVHVARRADAIGDNGIIVSDVSGKDYHGLSSRLLSQIKLWFNNIGKFLIGSLFVVFLFPKIFHSIKYLE